MTTEIVPIKSFEMVEDIEVALLVMANIIYDGYVKAGDHRRHAQLVEVKRRMDEMDCVQLSEAMFFYEHASGKFDPKNTYLR